MDRVKAFLGTALPFVSLYVRAETRAVKGGRFSLELPKIRNGRNFNLADPSHG